MAEARSVRQPEAESGGGSGVNVMGVLSIALDAIASSVIYSEDELGPGAAPTVHALSTRAILLNNGWIFAKLEDWPDLEETNAVLYLATQSDRQPEKRIVDFRTAMGRRGTVVQAATPDLPPFNRIDFLAALFEAAANVACPGVKRDDVMLAVAIPSYAFACDEGCTSAWLSPRLPTGCDGRIRKVTLNDEEFLADVRRAAARAGFGSVATELGAVAALRFYLQQDQDSRETLSWEDDNRLRACVLEFADDSVCLVSCEVTATDIKVPDRGLFVPLPWEQWLRESIGQAVEADWPQPASPAEVDAMWRRLRPLLHAAGARAFDIGTFGVELHEFEKLAGWKAVGTQFAAELAHACLAQTRTVMLMTEHEGERTSAFVRYVPIGLGTTVDSLLNELRRHLEGVRGAGAERLGFLEHQGTNDPYSPKPPKVRLRREAAAIGMLLDLALLEKTAKESPDYGADIYTAVSVKTPDDAREEKIELSTQARPLLMRSIALPDGRQQPVFRVEISRRRGGPAVYDVEFDLNTWEMHQRVEIELRVDDADRLEIAAMVGGAPSPAKVTGRTHGSHALGLGLGRFQLHADDDHRALSDAMISDGSRPAANVQVYSPM
jgi:hypothetical protein